MYIADLDSFSFIHIRIFQIEYQLQFQTKKLLFDSFSKLGKLDSSHQTGNIVFAVFISFSLLLHCLKKSCCTCFIFIPWCFTVDQHASLNLLIDIIQYCVVSIMQISQGVLINLSFTSPSLLCNNQPLMAIVFCCCCLCFHICFYF